MASISGRAANLMSRRIPAFGAWGTRRQVEQYRSSGGAKGNKIMGKPVFLLDVVGRTSGEPRPVMLMLVRRGDDVVVVGSNGGNPLRRTGTATSWPPAAPRCRWAPSGGR